MVNAPVIGRSIAMPLRKFLFAAFLIFIPFSQALTLNLLFPLKLSEIFLFCLVAVNLADGRLIKWRLNKPAVISLSLFILFVFCSVLVNVFYQYPYELALDVTRFNPAVDCVLKFFYIIIAFLALFATRNAFSEDQTSVKYFFIGAIVSSAYAWYLFVSGVLKIPAFLLPGMDANSQTFVLGSSEIIRSSTFKEGNYMGFYLLVAAIVAMHYKKGRLAAFFFITIITTFSTTAIFCAILFWVLFIFHRYKRYKLKMFAGLFSIALVFFLLIQFSDQFKVIFYNKIFGNEDTVENANDLYSKNDRLNTALVALQIFQDNPVLGVGPASFGLHFNHYNDFPVFEQEVKKIPNNIYVEVLSECGGLAFVMFLVFLYYVFRYGSKKSPAVFTAGIIACLVYFFAFPTFTMLFIWVFLGIILA